MTIKSIKMDTRFESVPQDGRAWENLVREWGESGYQFCGEFGGRLIFQRLREIEWEPQN